MACPGTLTEPRLRGRLLLKGLIDWYEVGSGFSSTIDLELAEQVSRTSNWALKGL